MWEPQLAAMSERGWHVVAPHVRGFGVESHAEFAESAGPKKGISANAASDVTMDDLAADVVDLLDGLHVHEAVVCGLSLGGYIALALLRMAPRYLHALVLAD